MLDADTHSGGIADVLKKATPYYSFLTEPSNSTLLDHRDDLIKHLFGTAGLWREYVRLEEGGKLVAEPQGLEAWAKDCDKLVEMMNLLLIFTMGQPPRCKEVESFLIRNTTTSRRSFYWTRGTLVLLQENDKTDGPGRRPKVKVRKLPKPLRPLFLVYMGVVRPAMVVVANMMGGPQEQAIYEDLWFVGRHKKKDGASIGPAIKEAFRAGEGKVKTMDAQTYRHFATWMSRDITVAYQALLTLDKPVHTQAGHSARTAELMYARDSEGLEPVSQRQWDEGMYVSEMWAKKILDLPADCRPHSRPGQPMVLDRPPYGEPPAVSDGPPSREPSVAEGLGCDHPRGSKSCSSGPRVTRPSPCMGAGLAPAAKCRMLLYQQPSPSAVCGTASNLDVQEEKYAHRAQRVLFSLGYAQWKMPEQAQAASLAVENVTDFIAVLPTGSGKSLIFMVAAMSRPQSIVVVVVPLKMLVGKQMESCIAARVPCHVFRKDNRPCHGANGVVFVSAEEAASGDFMSWARQLITMRHLHCICVDEVHLMLCCFRTKMMDLCRLGDLQCQMIGLTASLRPNRLPLLTARMGKFRLGIIRSETVRPNLVYAATKVFGTGKDAGGEAKMDALITRRLLSWLAVDGSDSRACEAAV
jgi:hypothetical protein